MRPSIEDLRCEKKEKRSQIAPDIGKARQILCDKKKYEPLGAES